MVLMIVNSKYAPTPTSAVAWALIKFRSRAGYTV